MKNIYAVFPVTAICMGLIICPPCFGEPISPAGSGYCVQGIKFRGGDRYTVSSTSLTNESTLLLEAKEQRECDLVKLFSLISTPREPVTEPDTKGKGGYSPKHCPSESYNSGVCIEKQHIFTQREILKILMWGPLSTLIMLPIGMWISIYISPRILEKRRRWLRYHDIKRKRFEKNNLDADYQQPKKTLWQRIWF